MKIYCGLTILEFIGLVVGGLTLIVLLVYYGAMEIIRAIKRRIKRHALRCPHGRLYSELCAPCVRIPDPSNAIRRGKK